MGEWTLKCPICGRPYKAYSHFAGDQSACQACRAEASRAIGGPDTQSEINRRRRYFY